RGGGLLRPAMASVVVFCGRALRRHLEKAAGRRLRYEFLAPIGAGARLRGFDAALVEIGARSTARTLKVLRHALPGRPLGSLSRRPSAEALKRSPSPGVDFHL